MQNQSQSMQARREQLERAERATAAPCTHRHALVNGARELTDAEVKAITGDNPNRSARGKETAMLE